VFENSSHWRLVSGWRDCFSALGAPWGRRQIENGRFPKGAASIADHIWIADIFDLCLNEYVV